MLFDDKREKTNNKSQENINKLVLKLKDKDSLISETYGTKTPTKCRSPLVPHAGLANGLSAAGLI